MRKSDLLQDAMGMVDEKLVWDARTGATGKGRRLLLRISAVAACVALLLGLSFWLIPRESTVVTAKNPWEAEGFRAYSLVYTSLSAQSSGPAQSPGIVFLSQTDAATVPSTTMPLPENVVVSTPISVSNADTIMVETLIGGRYAAYISDTGVPVFYDTATGVTVDLEERILGEDRVTIDRLLEDVTRIAKWKYPGILDAPENKEFFLEYVVSFVDRIPMADYDTKPLNTDFMDDLDGYRYTEQAYRRAEFSGMCWEAWTEALRDYDRNGDDYPYRPYHVKFISVDAVTGMCVCVTRDIVGNGGKRWVYDIRTDTLSTGIALNSFSDAVLRFSPDGNIITVASNTAVSSGANIDKDFTHRFSVESFDRWISKYQGEDITVYDRSTGKSYRLSGTKSASEGFISESGSVVYYKKMDSAAAGKSFFVSDLVWYNRLDRYDRDTDSWVFCSSVADGDPYSQHVTLQGNFVRLIGEESAVIMEREGRYYAYRLKDGQDITRQVTAGDYPMMAHERLMVYQSDGFLYKKDLFSGEAPQLIGKADTFILSQDGAFAVYYGEGERVASCVNVATLEGCAIALDAQLTQQMQNTEGAVFRINYNESENSLLFSFYVPEAASETSQSGVDFFGQLRELVDEKDGNWESVASKVITDRPISEEMMNEFRASCDRYLHPDGVVSWETYYPPGLSAFEDRFTIFEKLGITPPEDYLDVNGTKFILYEDDDERLVLTFWQYWKLYDWNGNSTGFMMEYYLDGVPICFYEFANPQRR